MAKAIKISVITVCLNSQDTIRRTLESVQNQTHHNIEHIIVDGKSNDNTIDIVKGYDHVAKVISEQDSGLYEAMNKGIDTATGDIVGFLNSDDFYTDETVLEQIACQFTDNDVDAIYADVQYVVGHDINKIVRYYSSSSWNVSRLKYGFLPAHPTFYVKRHLYSELGMYKTDYKIAADFDLILRFFTKKKIKFVYIKKPLVTMLRGGISTRNIRSKYIAGKETLQSCRENGIKSNWLFMFYRFFVKSIEVLST